MIWAFAALIIAGIAAPFVAEFRRPKMDQTVRRTAPGPFAQLSHGVTHYQWLGPTQGPVAICVHGLTTPSFVWGPIAQGLAQMGFRVLTYDLYGRGYSDRPKGAQDAAFFLTQLNDLMDHEDVKNDVTLLGYSMGGAIASAFAADTPDRLRRLVLLAPAGFGHDLGPIARLMLNRPKLGKWLMMAFYGRSFRQATEAERDLDTSIKDIVDRQQAELGYRGFRPAVLASLRDLLDHDQEAEHRKISHQDVPVLAIWGQDDEVIPIAGLDKLGQWNTTARQEVIKGAGHALAYTHTDKVLHAMRDLLDKRS